MKYITVLLCTTTLLSGMQRVAVLKVLADEKRALTLQDITNAHVFLKGLKSRTDKKLLAKALWGLAAAWDDTFGNKGLEIAEILIHAQADPYALIEVAEIASLSKKKGGYSYILFDCYQTSAMCTAKGALKKYFEERISNTISMQP